MSDRNFGAWLGENGLDDLGKNDRAAAISLGQNLDLARKVLEETKSRSLRLIWENNQGRYSNITSFPNAGKGEKSEKPSTTNKSSSQIPDLVNKFGEKVGRPVYSHFARNTRTLRKLQKLTKGQMATLSAFISEHAGQLPEPANSEDRLGLRTIWREAPHSLCRPYTVGDSATERAESKALMQVLADWPERLALHYAAWLKAGKPDPARWWSRVAPLPQAAPVTVFPSGGYEARTGATAISEQLAAIDERIRKQAEAAALPRKDRFCRPSHEGPIRHHGVDIRPGTEPKYSFLEAWYAITMWRLIDAALRVSQPNPRTRVAGFLKVLVGCMRNLNPAGGEALSAVLNAQDLYPEKTGPEDNECPPYDSIQ